MHRLVSLNIAPLPFPVHIDPLSATSNRSPARDWETYPYLAAHFTSETDLLAFSSVVLPYPSKISSRPHAFPLVESAAAFKY